MSDIDDMVIPPPQVRGNRQELFILLHTLWSNPKAQGTTQKVLNKLTDKGLGTLTNEGHTIIRRIIEKSDDGVTIDLRQWIHQLLDQTRDQTPRKPVTVSTHNFGPVGITESHSQWMSLKVN